MADARLRTALWVQACVRQGSVRGIPVVVVRKGDETSGAVLVKLNGFAKGCTVLVETRDTSGARAWLRGTGESPVTEQDADAYIERSRRRDPDLWIVEVEDRGGSLPFDGEILKT